MLAVLLHVSWNDASALTCLQCCFMYLEMMLQHSHAGSVAACLLTIRITSHSGTQQVTPRNMLAVLLHVDITDNTHAARRYTISVDASSIKKHDACTCKRSARHKAKRETRSIAAIQVCFYHKLKFTWQSERIYIYIYSYIMPYRSKHCIKVWRSRVLGIPNAFEKYLSNIFAFTYLRYYIHIYIHINSLSIVGSIDHRTVARTISLVGSIDLALSQEA